MLNRVIDPLEDKYLWPEWLRSALITIDVQRDFSLEEAVAQIPGTMEAVKNIQVMLAAYRKRSLPIFHVVRIYLDDASNVDICRRSAIESGARIASPGTEGSEIVQELLPMPGIKLDHDLLLLGQLQQIAPNEWVIYKPRFGAFYQTRLDDFLKDNNINTLVFCGCNFPNCPRTTIYEAAERDYRIVMATDAVSGLYDKGIQELSHIGINLMTSDQIITNLDLL
ncbi:MAG: cysteine hydrolase family protein [Desulfomonilaceae bacterium]